MINGDDTGTPLAVRSGDLEAIVEAAGDGFGLRVLRDGRDLLGTIPLGPVVAGTACGTASTVLEVSARDVSETLSMATGKARGDRRFVHRELTVRFGEPDGTRWDVVVRIAPDGVAFRYRLPALDGVTAVDGDRASIPLGGIDRLWMLEYQTWYETPRFGADVGTLADGAYGLPALVRTATGDHVLITESGMDGRFSGSHLVASDGALRFTPAETIEVTRGEVSPWRVLVAGDLSTLVESRFVDELAPAPAPGLDFSWVRPGRAAWSWWSDFYSGAQLEHQQRFVDDAASLGWEHLLIDCGWDATWVPEIVAYAGRRGIQVHLWTVWRDLNGPENLRRLALWRSWGVAGIKVDFMESESKDRHRWYDALLAEAARVGLMVNVHGSVIPRGAARTWPHLVGYEAVRGAEYYVFYEEAMAPAHNVILPFTRNPLGAMDYTPVAFSAPSRLTTEAHELALSVVFECGITHFADDTARYLERPAVARFLAELAPAWHETLLLAGDPDGEAVIARRSGDRWFVGVIAAGPARTIAVPLHRLGLGPADVWIVGEGLAERALSGVDAFEVDVAADGGAVAIVVAAGAEIFRARPRPVLDPPAVEPAAATLRADGTAELVVSAGSALRLPPGWWADGEGERRVIHAPSGATDGVVTVELPGPEGVPVVAHARLQAPLPAGQHRVSALPFLAFRNADGPVERDGSNGGGNPADGGPLRIAGRRFEHGLGLAAPGWVRLHLDPGADTFSALVGIDDETTEGWEVFGGRRSAPPATATVRVLVDGTEAGSVTVRSGEAAVPLTVRVAGGGTLELHYTADGEAHVDLAEAILHVRDADGAPTPTAGHR